MAPSKAAEGRSATHERLKSRLVQAGKRPPEGGGTSGRALEPPGDPNILITLQDAQALFETDRKKATVLFKLAARKGYAPALVLLANKAQQVADEGLVLDALVMVLVHKDAPLQIPSHMLRSYAEQVSIMVKKAEHREFCNSREAELDAIAAHWPFVRQAREQGTLLEIQRLCRLGGAGKALCGAGDVSLAGGSPPQELADIQRLCRSGATDKVIEPLQELLASQGSKNLQVQIEAVKSENDDLTALILALDKEVGSAKRREVEVAPVDVVQPMSPDVGSAELISMLRRQNSHALRKAPTRQWRREPSAWLLTAGVPHLEAIPEGSLTISEVEIRLGGPIGGEFLVEPVPNKTDWRQAKAKWCDKERLLTVVLPMLPGAEGQPIALNLAVDGGSDLCTPAFHDGGASTVPRAADTAKSRDRAASGLAELVTRPGSMSTLD